ncbi:alpha/beta hydrolase [Legionella bononiensis]|uniref:Alpha/beta hydrolase n=1 Tax=Legionella bononiensis TaxID=2793102 RepID=A0ABS1WAL6_9GAMM|nr:alpha/beta hydrolase [Legionella bononiensis]MBL7480371.1 alpha/beta hydrolase [Legionella bononiensis]MBL7526397.1 alpha/beta hydrolase [Legionella bononiensis]MBL7563109.1 alpha/beta hydrolase [Legionella bononiensis]
MSKTNFHSGANPDKNNIPFELAVRLEGFINLGIPRHQLMHVINQASAKGKPGSEEWSRSIRSHADEFAKMAGDCEEDWLEASFWYFLARFPHYFNDEMKSAYERHKECYLKSCSFSLYPMEKIAVEFKGQTIDTYLHLPKVNNDSPLPLAIIWGGIDIWKSDIQIHQIGRLLLEKGIAVLAIDSPGTGDCSIPISSSAENWFFAVLHEIRKRPNMNYNKIACYGLSFGGYWATKLAIQLPWLAGSINIGGPVHATFDAEHLKQLPHLTRDALAYSCRIEPNEQRFLSLCSDLSLINQGLLPALSNAPLLLINGAKDNLVKITEIDCVNAHCTNTDTLIFSQDRHAASQNWHLHSQFSTDWLEKKLNV